MKTMFLSLLISVSLFAQSQDVRQSVYANRPAASTYPNFYWTIIDCNSTTNCTSGGGALGTLGTFFSDGTSWTQKFVDYNSLLNKPTIPAVAKLYIGTSTTVGTGGVATFNISATGFSAAPTVCHFGATTGTATPANSYNAVGLVATAWTAFQVQAYVTQPIAILLGGLGVGPVGAGITVQATCYP